MELPFGKEVFLCQAGKHIERIIGHLSQAVQAKGAVDLPPRAVGGFFQAFGNIGLRMMVGDGLSPFLVAGRIAGEQSQLPVAHHHGAMATKIQGGIEIRKVIQGNRGNDDAGELAIGELDAPTEGHRPGTGSSGDDRRRYQHAASRVDLQVLEMESIRQRRGG